jgi:ribosomal protein S18 acetylase RimI-like enzyme
VNVVSLGFRTDLMLRRLAGAVITEQPSYLAVRTPGNPGFWWGNFLLVDRPFAAGDADRWADIFAREIPGAAHLTLGVDGVDGDAGDAAELARLGVTVEVDTVLTATRLTPPARPPVGATIRPLSGDADWAEAFELRLAAHGEQDAPAEHRQYVARKVAEERALCDAGHGVWFGVFVDGRLGASAGLFADGDGDGLGRYQSVETHPDLRRRGLASALVHRLGDWGSTERGVRTLVIVADPDYHAIRLYRALGFTDTEKQVQLCREPPVAEA